MGVDREKQAENPKPETDRKDLEIRVEIISMTEENYTLLFPYMYDRVKMNEGILQQSFVYLGGGKICH